MTYPWENLSLRRCNIVYGAQMCVPRRIRNAFSRHPTKEVWLVCLLYQAFFLRKSAASWMWTNDETLLKIHKWTSLVEQTLVIISARLVYNTFKYISHQNSVKLRAQCNSMTTSFKEVLFQNHKPKLLWQYELK